MEGIYFLSQIREIEKCEIENLNERRNSLIELKNIINSNTQSELIANINSDINDLQKSIVKWWSDIAAKYKWEYDKRDEFLVDFNENNVFLKKNDK